LVIEYVWRFVSGSTNYTAHFGRIPKDDDGESTDDADKSDDAKSDDGDTEKSTDDEASDDKDAAANKTARPASGKKGPATPTPADVAHSHKPLPRGKVTPALRNEGIAFGIAGLLAYLIGTGNGGRKQEVRAESRNEQNDDA